VREDGGDMNNRMKHVTHNNREVVLAKCEACDGRCCRQGVSVSAKERKMLMKKLEPLRIERFYYDHHKWCYKIVPWNVGYDPVAGRCMLKCPFLDESVGRCLIYEDRPRVCREFDCTVHPKDR